MKITVAIPTIAGREKYLHASLLTCVSQDVEELEILVSDNSEERGAWTVVEQFHDRRIKYINPPTYMPMSKHWDFVGANVSGDVFTIIGDDDGLMPGCIQRVSDLLKTHGLHPIHHSLCNYFWPDCSDASLRNRIQFFHGCDGRTTVEDGETTFRKLCSAEARYVDGPMVYHNFIPTTLVRSLTRDGMFFRRAAPDVYSSVALSAACPKYLSISQYLTLSGQSSRSNGNAVRLGKKEGKAFMAEMHANFRPRFTSQTVQLALLDAVYEVIDTYDRRDVLADVDVAAHLFRAAREARGIVGADKKFKELFHIGTVGLRHGVMMKTATSLAKNLLRHLIKGRSGMPARHAPKPIECDTSVTDIYTASLFLRRHLEGQTAVESAKRPVPLAAAAACHAAH